MAPLMIKVKAGDLKDKLSENRMQHHQTYNQAMKDYWNEYERRLNGALATLALMKNDHDKNKPPEHPTQGLVPPTHHLSDYDVAISMMERVLPTTEIELSQDQYQQLWMDDWGWKQSFNATNASYSGAR